MQEWINRALETPGMGFTVLLALLVLGVVSAAATSCCSLPAIGAIAGYAGASESNRRRDIAIMAVSFAAGSILALALIGAGIGYGGQLLAESFGRWSRLAVGLVLVILGLMSLGLTPFRLPALRVPTRVNPTGVLTAMVLGSALGGSSATCAVSCCSPALLGVMGVIAVEGQVAKGALMMAVFAAGFSIPLVAVLVGASLGRWTLRASRAVSIIKTGAGILMVGLGFYFLLTL